MPEKQKAPTGGGSRLFTKTVLLFSGRAKTACERNLPKQCSRCKVFLQFRFQNRNGLGVDDCQVGVRIVPHPGQAELLLERPEVDRPHAVHHGVGGLSNLDVALDGAGVAFTLRAAATLRAKIAVVQRHPPAPEVAAVFDWILLAPVGWLWFLGTL